MNCNNSNLEFRKIKSLNFLYEINENGTIIRNVKSKKQNRTALDYQYSEQGCYVTFIRMKDGVKKIPIHELVAECWLGENTNGYEIEHIDGHYHNNDYRNLRYAKRIIKRVILHNDKEKLFFESYASCTKFLSEKYGISTESFRYRLKSKRSHILDYDVTYLNAETRHDGSTEQGIVHSKNDLTGDYKTAFNEGKQQEVEMRVRHQTFKD